MVRRTSRTDGSTRSPVLARMYNVGQKMMVLGQGNGYYTVYDYKTKTVETYLVSYMNGSYHILYKARTSNV